MPKEIETIASKRRKVMEAALALASEQGWQYTTLRDIALRAELSIAEMLACVEDKDDILVLIEKNIEEQCFKNIHVSYDDGLSIRERLFDTLMERFDVLSEYREGLLSILDAMVLDPKALMVSSPYLCKSMARILEVCGAETAGVKGSIKILGVTAIYLRILKVWREDETQDLSKTMAALDKALGKAEHYADSFGF